MTNTASFNQAYIVHYKLGILLWLMRLAIILYVASNIYYQRSTCTLLSLQTHTATLQHTLYLDIYSSWTHISGPNLIPNLIPNRFLSVHVHVVFLVDSVPNVAITAWAIQNTFTSGKHQIINISSTSVSPPPSTPDRSLSLSQ